MAEHSGFLSKKSPTTSKFQKRWFELVGGRLFYYSDKKDTTPLGVILLKNCTVTKEKQQQQNGELFSIVGSHLKAPFELEATSESECDSWVDALLKAIRREGQEETRQLVEKEILRIASNAEGLSKLDLSGKHMEDDLGRDVFLAMSDDKNFRLKTLIMCKNDLTNEVIPALAHMFETNHAIESLELEGNKFDDEGINAIIVALSSNWSLTDLTVSELMTDEQWDQMDDLLDRNYDRHYEEMKAKKAKEAKRQNPEYKMKKLSGILKEHPPITKQLQQQEQQQAHIVSNSNSSAISNNNESFDASPKNAALVDLRSNLKKVERRSMKGLLNNKPSVATTTGNSIDNNSLASTNIATTHNTEISSNIVGSSYSSSIMPSQTATKKPSQQIDVDKNKKNNENNTSINNTTTIPSKDLLKKVENNKSSLSPSSKTIAGTPVVAAEKIPSSSSGSSGLNPFKALLQKQQQQQQKQQSGELHHLLQWVNNQLIDDSLKVSNWTTSFQNGKVFCALANALDDSVSFDPTKSADQNILVAFKAFEKLGIDTYLDPQDAAKEQKSMMLCLKTIRDFFRSYSY